MVQSAKLGPLVGDGKFFHHVSSRMAYALPIAHPFGLRDGSHAASMRPGSHMYWDADFFTNERAVGFNAYDCNPANRRFVAAGCRVLLGTLPSCAALRGIQIRRSTDGEGPVNWLDAATGVDGEFPIKGSDAVDTEHRAVNPCFLPTDQVAAEFPAFDLFASRIDAPRITDDPHSWPTVKLACAENMTDPLTFWAEAGPKFLPMTGGCEEWLVWMRPIADVPENSFMWIEGDLLVVGK